jgi:NAD(P)-dependent dehydrogenase (short-subunit alcohol dehydrogenase family)
LGAKVVIGDLQFNQDAQKLVDGSGGNAVFKKTDVTNWKELNELVSLAKEKFGSTPDVYIAGAGIFEPASSTQVLPVRSMLS